MIEVTVIQHDNLTSLMNKYDAALSLLKSPPFYIDSIYSYPKYLSGLFKAIDDTYIHELRERISFNSELENKLRQQGNDVQAMGENNPQNILIEIADLLLKENIKSQKLFEILKKNPGRRPLVIANNSDIEFINLIFEGIATTTYSQIDKFLEANSANKFYVVDYSLEGYNDFLKYYNYDFIVHLLLYEQEKEMCDSFLKKYQKELEVELTSPFREKFSGIKYPIISDREEEKPLSATIQSIIENAEHRDEDDFIAIKENPELDASETIRYTIIYEEHTPGDELNSNDYVFNEENRLIRIGKIEAGDKIRVYNEKLNINLYEIAEKEDEETFDMIEYYSKLWQDALLNYYHAKLITAEDLFELLKNQGLTVTEATLRNYLHKRVKFPMRTADLEAIRQLTADTALQDNMKSLLKYKRIYNGVMIALGRNLKEEIRDYLQSKKVGSILKGKFTKEMLDTFIKTNMPFRTVKEIKRTITE